MKIQQKILPFLFLIACVFSCRDAGDNVVPPSELPDENMVSIDEAIAFASVQTPNVISGNGRTARQKIKRAETLKRGGTLPAAYVVNYEGGGFVILSADNRLSPVLAHSDASTFRTDTLMPEGLKEWLDGIGNTVRQLRSAHVKQDPAVKRLWKSYTETPKRTRSKNGRIVYGQVGDCNNGDTQFYQTVSVDPLVLSTWDQTAGYNNLLANWGCGGTGNGRVLTGCVATAMAQVMRYWQFPTTYTWGAMPLGSGSAETSRLMRDLGLPANLNMSYSCTASGAFGTAIPGTFANFGYPTPNYASYNYNTVRFDLANDRPVVMGGSGPSGGHCWVVDGFSEQHYYTCGPDPNTPGEWISTYVGVSKAIHVNWGWSGVFNGYFGTSNFNPGSMSFNTNDIMVTNIHP
ncbi:C10 family peptidase [Chryseolinea lacunae]|uniref:C10 family peptidase n=1 Tax=Chryseolinea lacunae TaxID=2801331 RepID=A0ABS1KVC7_9BACT|nr:C10 family peptidase [Chryseolinea lacunae]MBL0743396.1 C10 family peptidase [Chryseolinea lacunae]